MSMENKSELTLVKEGLTKRLQEFFTKEGFDKTEITFEFNGNDDHGNRRVVVNISASTDPFASRKR